MSFFMSSAVKPLPQRERSVSITGIIDEPLVSGIRRLLWMHSRIREMVRGEITMPLEITQRETNGIYLLALKGRLVLGQESSGLLTMVDTLLASGAARIVINLDQVHYVDSAGLGALIEMHRKTKAKGGGLKLCNLGPNLRQALEMARLLPIFETCPSETAAIASF
jgi:anti-sigma B factor antagonist